MLVLLLVHEQVDIFQGLKGYRGQGGEDGDDGVPVSSVVQAWRTLTAMISDGFH